MSFLEKGRVLKNQQLADDLYELEFLAPQIASQCQPGKFLQIRVSEQDDPLLRRPLSIYDVDVDSGSITLLYKVVGQGTRIMTSFKPEETLDVMGPLGNGFTMPSYPLNAILVGGGVGIAPLVFLARWLKLLDCEVKVLYGANTAAELVASDRFSRLGAELVVATMDGSAGYHGPVTDLLKDQDPNEVDSFYTCGPEMMMAEVAEYVGYNYLWGECSLEEHMACGVGACLGCARKLKPADVDYVKICKDGPVFNVHDVDFKMGR